MKKLMKTEIPSWVAYFIICPLFFIALGVLAALYPPVWLAPVAGFVVYVLTLLVKWFVIGVLLYLALKLIIGVIKDIWRNS